MWPYFALLLLNIIAIYFGQKSDSTINNLMWIIAFAFLILFAGLRRIDVGADSVVYATKFSRITTIDQVLKEREIGYPSLCWLGHMISDDYVIVNLLSAIIIVGCFIFGIRKHSHNQLMTVFVYLVGGTYITPFNIIRQGIAISIMFLAIKTIYAKNFKCFIKYVAVAFLFHKSVIVTVPAFFILIQKNTIKLYVIIFTIGLLSVLFFDYLINIGVLIDDKFAQYSGYHNDSIGLVSTAYLIAVCLFFIGFKKRVIQNRFEYEILLNMFVLGVSICIVSAFLGLGGSGPRRLSEYFTISSLLLWPIVYQNLYYNERPFFNYSFTSCFLIFYYLFLSSFGHFIPYRLNPIIYKLNL